MKNTQTITKIGEVTETLPSLKFRVRLEDGKEIIAYLSGRLAKFRIRVLPGDQVTVEMTPYDQDRGRIVFRGVKKKSAT